MGRSDRNGDRTAEEGKRGDGRRSPTSPSTVATPSRGGRSRDGNEKVRGSASALEDLMRRKGVDEAWTALEEMQRQGVSTDKYTVSRMLMKTVGDGRTRLTPSRVYHGISLVERFIEMQPKDVDEVLFNALLDTCCRLKDLPRLEATVNRMRELKVSASPVTLGILVKTYGQAGDLPKVLQVWSEMEKQRGQANAVTYGCMIDACVKCGNLAKAVEIFKSMRQVGKHRNTILYTTLIKGYGLEKDLVSALELFREMPVEGVPYNTITYNSILDACVKCGDLATAEGLLREMTSPESTLEPDLITFSTLLKGYCHIGELDKALQVAEAIKSRGLRCDELVYNTLMDGCVKANDVTAGVGLFEEMVQNGMRPSAITHSILARLYQRAGYEEESWEAVAQLYQHHGIERPSGGERGKGSSRRWNQRSPGGGGGQRSPFGSPSAASATSGFALGRERSDSVCSEGGWSSWGMPAMPGYDCTSADPSAPSTPHCSSLQASPVNGGAPYLPMEALRTGFVPPLPSSGCPEGSSYSQTSWTPMGSMPTTSFVGSPGCTAGSPTGGQDQNGFSVPASPQTMQAGFGPVGSPQNMHSGFGSFGVQQNMQAQPSPFPMPISPPHDLSNCGQMGQAQVPQQQQWSCAGPLQNYAAAGMTAPPPPPSCAPGEASAMQQVMAMRACPAPSPAPSGGAFGAIGSGETSPPSQAAPSSFPMPNSQQHDLTGGGQQQAYFQSWTGSQQMQANWGQQQQVSSGMQMSGGSPGCHGQFLS